MCEREKNYSIKVTLTDVKTGKELDYFEDWEDTEDYAKAYFSHIENAHKTFN